LKPQVGDDYPTVLRKMKTRPIGHSDGSGRYWPCDGVRALVVDRFQAEGATWDQVKKMFGSSRIEVRTLAEICALMRQEV
jgi:hypothetical protein